MWGILIALLSGALMSVQDQYRTYKADQSVGIYRVGTDFGFSDLRAGMAFHRKAGGERAGAGRS